MPTEECIEKISRIVSTSDGRDKFCKGLQYTIKLALFINANCFERRFGLVLQRLKHARQVLRLFRFLNASKEIRSSLNQKRPYINFACTTSGKLGEFLDDLCWLSECKVLPSWISDYGVVVDYIWFFELLIEVPMQTKELHKAICTYRNISIEKQRNDIDDIELYNARVHVFLHLLTQIKLLADFMHCSRLVFNFPTKSKGQDAICGLLSAFISLYKLWKPQHLKLIKLPTHSE